MKIKKLVALLSALTLTLACSACALFDFGNSSASESNYESSVPTESSTPDDPDDSDDSIGSDDPVDPDDPVVIPGTVGVLECGAVLYHGNTCFFKDADGMEGWYRIAACEHGATPKQYVYIPYLEGKDTLGFTIKSDAAQHPIQGAFKLSYNNAIYSYDAERNAWFDEDGNQGAITMKDDKGEDVDFGSLRYKAKWPWTRFTISGVQTKVEIIIDFDNCVATAESIWKAFHALIKDIRWTGDGAQVDPPVEGNGKKVLLVSIDGLRPDAIAESEFVQGLQEISSYSLNATTINPSVTLPAHTSMFYGVDPTVHGVINNDCVKDSNLGNGITETLAAAGRTSAMFYDWKKLENLTTSSSVSQLYINGDPGTTGKEWFEDSTVALTDAVIEHVTNTPTDFTFLYYALTDEMGHTYNWMSEKYEWGIEHVFNNLQRVLDALSEEYVVIITSDHGGGGSNGANNHGSQHANDMTIPFFMYGEGIEVGVLNGVSILDIAPTVVEALGVTAETYWVGNDLADATPVKPDEPVIPDNPTETKVGTIEYGISVWDGNKIFSCTNGVYEFAAKLHGGYPKQYVYIPYDGNYTTLSFALHSKRTTFGDRFNLVFNGKVYTYNAVDNCWYDENNEQGNITMKTEKGEDVNLGTFVTKQEVDGETVYNWVVFTIENVATDVEIVYANLASHSDGAHFGAKDIIWSGVKTRPEDPEAAAFDVLASLDSYVNVPRGSVKSVTSTENTVTVGGAVNPENGNTFSAFGLSKTAVDTWVWLGFKYFTFTVGLSADEGATVPTNLYIYEWAEVRAFLTAEADYIPNNSVVTINLETLAAALAAEVDHPYLIFAFTINGDWIATGADAYLTFSNITFSTTAPAPQEPVVCEHSWTDATCAMLKTCALCGATEGELAGHTYGDLIPEVPATEEAAGMAAHFYCAVCETYFDADKNETTREDLTIEYVPVIPVAPEEKAFNILASEDSYADVYLGNFKSVTSTENTVTVGGTVNTANGNAFSAFGLKKDAVEAWLALGYKFITFTVDFSADAGATVPTHLYIFEYTEKRAFLITDYSYVASNKVVTLALETLKTALDAETEHPHLIFAFTINGKWEATGADGYLTFSNIEFSETAPETATGEALIDGGNWAVGFDDKGWGQYWISSTQQARAIVEYKAGYNALTFKMKGDWAEPGFAGVFKFKVDAIDYEYKKVGDVWGWYNGEVINTNIAMYDENGDVMDISSLNTMPAGGWPWVTFVITGIGSSSNVEIISMNENSNGHPAWGPIVTLFVKNIVWSFEEVSDPVIPEEPTAEEKAFEILASADSYVNVPRGSVKSVTSTENTVTIGGAVNPEGGNTFSAFGLSKTAVEAWLNLDMKYLTFTIGLSADDGATVPTHIYMYDWAETMDFVLDWEPWSYIPNGTTVTFNLEKLNALLISEHPYLIFAFTNGGDWVPTGADAYFTFSGVKFSATAPAPTGPKAGTLEYGVSLYNGSQVFWWNQGGENEWQFAATPHGSYAKQYVYVPYEEGYNTLTVTLGSWRSYFASSFKLGYNGKLYAYNATENAWFDEEGNKGNITVKTESGEDINLATLEGADSQPWVVFTIEGITTDLEIVYVFANADVHLGAKDNMVWSVKES